MKTFFKFIFFAFVCAQITVPCFEGVENHVSEVQSRPCDNCK